MSINTKHATLLGQLADLLDTVQPVHFGMKHFRGDRNEEGEVVFAEFTRPVDGTKMVLAETPETMCGTVGCAMGFVPFLEGAEEFMTWNGNKDSCVNFNALSLEAFGITCGEAAWCFLFDDEWADIDDTPQGAAKRIRYLLDNVTPDGEWDDGVKMLEGYTHDDYDDTTEYTPTTDDAEAYEYY